MMKKSLLVILFAIFFFFISGCQEAQKLPEENIVKPIDSAIKASIETSLRSDLTLRNLNISVVVEKGVVTISGEVESQESLLRVINLVRKTEGVKEVKNQLKINPNLNP